MKASQPIIHRLPRSQELLRKSYAHFLGKFDSYLNRCKQSAEMRVRIQEGMYADK